MADEETLCLGENGRFEVRVEWRSQLNESGSGTPAELDRRDSGLFYFFHPDNLELLVKVLDACTLSDRFWVFAAATTNVEFTLRVTDSVTGISKRYFNPLGKAAQPIQDVDAFATCP